LKRAAILVAAMACVAAAPNDHAILERAFAGGRNAELESDLYNGKAALYRPIRVPVRIEGMAGEGCESRLAARGRNGLTLDWRAVRRLELAMVAGKAQLYIVGGTPADKLIITFPTRDEGTPVLLAMERLQTACRPAIRPWP
jgi:hypothetical protein